MRTLNVCSMNNKLQAIRQFIDGHRISIIAITENRVQQGGYDGVSIEEMARVNSWRREAGQTRGGVAIYVDETVPCFSE